MAGLTKEHFDQQLKEQLQVQTKHIRAYTDEQTEALARTVNQAFQQHSDYLDKKFEILESGQEDIKLRLDQAAWRFETDALDKRVKVLEDKAGVVREKR